MADYKTVHYVQHGEFRTDSCISCKYTILQIVHRQQRYNRCPANWKSSGTPLLAFRNDSGHFFFSILRLMSRNYSSNYVFFFFATFAWYNLLLGNWNLWWLMENSSKSLAGNLAAFATSFHPFDSITIFDSAVKKLRHLQSCHVGTLRLSLADSIMTTIALQKIRLVKISLNETNLIDIDSCSILFPEHNESWSLIKSNVCHSMGRKTMNGPARNRPHKTP